MTSFRAVVTELEGMYQADLQRSPRNRSTGHVFVTDAHLQRWSATTEIPRNELYDRIAIYLARDFYHSKLDFGFCDQIVNDLRAVITIADEHRPELFWEVFLGFDAGEFYPSNDRTRDPVEAYTRPPIAKVVEKHSANYPDMG
jgi:hypothetical protein